MRNRKAQGRARALRLSPTDAERHLWYFLRRKYVGGAYFRRQRVVGPYIVDFVCLECRVVIELDGGQHQTTIQYDLSRSRFLEARGFRVLRFWNNEVFEQTEGVLERIREAVVQGRSEP